MGNTAGLPLVVVVKTAEPTEIVDRFVQMHLMAGGAKFGGIIAVEGLQEASPVRFRVKADEIVMEFFGLKPGFSLAAILCSGG